MRSTARLCQNEMIVKSCIIYAMLDLTINSDPNRGIKLTLPSANYELVHQTMPGFTPIHVFFSPWQSHHHQIFFSITPRNNRLHTKSASTI
jgi:hypothetical protein